VLLGEAQDSVRYVYAIEAPFGLDEVPPAVLDGPTGRLMARGLIDRIDRIGDKLVIIDYKSGSSLPDMKEIERGRNFQMMLYLHAAHQLLAKSSSHLTLVAGAFWSLRQPDKPVLIPAHDSRLLDAYITLHTNINAARAGDFRVQPRKMEDGKCSRYCEYHHLCREIPADLYKSG
jgi:ATP-dependent helicase/DNAse subunit B